MLLNFIFIFASSTGPKILICGGYNGTELKDTEIMNLKTGHVIKLPDLPNAKYGAFAIMRLFLFLGLQPFLFLTCLMIQ